MDVGYALNRLRVAMSTNCRTRRRRVADWPRRRSPRSGKRVATGCRLKAVGRRQRLTTPASRSCTPEAPLPLYPHPPCLSHLPICQLICAESVAQIPQNVRLRPSTHTEASSRCGSDVVCLRCRSSTRARHRGLPAAHCAPTAESDPIPPPHEHSTRPDRAHA